MTWLSRLLPQSPRLQRLADHNHRTRQAQRRRRMATLETLEGRTLLSNVVTGIVKAPTGALTLTITGDMNRDSFLVTENASGTVSVQATDARTIINGTYPINTAYTTTQAISNIEIILPGSGLTTDNVSLTGHGTVQNVAVVVPGVSTTTPAVDVNLDVYSVNNSGYFALYDAPTTGTGPNAISPAFSPTSPFPAYTFPTDTNGNPLNYLGGTLNATVTDSHFTALTIEQDGCCPANVTLTNDVVPGNVLVYEGVANGDTVTAAADNFGATTIVQYYGPTMANCTGKGDHVYINQTAPAGTSNIASLAISQYGPGSGQDIDVGTLSEVEVSVNGFGIIAEQPNAGGSDQIVIQSITVYGRLSNSPGAQGGPASIFTFQGNGGGEYTDVDSSTVPGNITVTQLDGGGDNVHIANDVIGYTQQVGSYFVNDYYGLLWITQGNGAGDIVTVDSNGSEPTINPLGSVFNNVIIQQGNGGGPVTPTCVEVTGYDDQVLFNEATVTSDLFIVQNATFTVTAYPTLTPGVYNFLIPVSYFPFVAPVPEPTGSPALEGSGTGFNLVQIGTTAPVTVGEQTYGFQGGGLNEVDLGGASGDVSGLVDFETLYLDIWTGAGGGGYVYATKTTVEIGSFYGLDSVINGGGTGNTYVQKTTPVLTWANPADITYGTALSATQLNANTTVDGSLAYSLAAGTVLSAGQGQTLSTTFTPTDQSDYNDATASVLINVQQAAPTFSGLTESQTITYGTATIDVAGTLSSATAIPVGQDVTVTINGAATTAEVGADGSFAATIDTATLPASATPYPIAYGYAGDANFQSASDSTTMLTVNKATPVITWNDPVDITYGTALSGTQLNATTPVPGSFVYRPAAGTVLSAGANETLSVTFTPTDTADYNSVTRTVTINVQKATPTITWANPAGITYGTALGATQLDATASVPGSFVYRPAAGTVLSAGANETLSVRFTPTDTADYNSVTRTATINVSKAHTTAPPAPAFTATPISTTTVGISWPVTSTATTYYVAEFIGTTWQLIATLPQTTTAFTVAGLHPGSSYLFAVGAGNINGYTWAVAQQVTTLSHPAAPTAMVVSSTRINLTWASVPGAQAYYVAEVINGNWQLISTTTNTSLAVTGLTPATKYTFAQGMLYNNTIYWLNSPVVATTKA